MSLFLNWDEANVFPIMCLCADCVQLSFPLYVNLSWVLNR